LTGFLLVDKPRGITSHDVVARVRRTLDIRRVGHAGTLDPLATGLLVIALGPATRFLRYVQDLPKTYDVTAVLGVATTTLDAEGEIVERKPVDVTPDDIKRAASELTGEIDQVPPAVSAIKIEGERAYKRARRGEAVEMPVRRVTVYSFDVRRTSPDAFEARIECSSGTYIRSLVADVGTKLSCGAHVAHLRRIAIGDLDVLDAVELDALDPSAVMPVERALAHLPRLDVDAATAAFARNGRAIEGAASDGETLVVGPEGAVGIFDARGGVLKPVTVVGT
jgi:tRNA pseudouridine55 synthase